MIASVAADVPRRQSGHDELAHPHPTLSAASGWPSGVASHGQLARRGWSHSSRSTGTRPGTARCKQVSTLDGVQPLLVGHSLQYMGPVPR